VKEDDKLEVANVGTIHNSYHHLTNNLWKQLTLQRWKNFSLHNNISNWLKLYQRRLKAERSNSSSFYDSSLIDACPEMEFKCPLDWNFVGGTVSPSTGFCLQCKKPVYNVDTLEELDEHARKGDCVVFKARVQEKMIIMGRPKPVRRTICHIA
jgi:hypothetical protein